MSCLGLVHRIKTACWDKRCWAAHLWCSATREQRGKALIVTKWKDFIVMFCPLIGLSSWGHSANRWHYKCCCCPCSSQLCLSLWWRSYCHPVWERRKLCLFFSSWPLQFLLQWLLALKERYGGCCPKRNIYLWKQRMHNELGDGDQNVQHCLWVLEDQ